MKAINISFLICLIGFLTNCNNQMKDHQNQYDDEFYKIVNYLVDSQFTDASAIISRTLFVIKPFQIPSDKIVDTIIVDTINETETPNNIQYNWLSIYSLAQRRSLSRADVDFMYESIDSSKFLVIDSSRVRLPVISKEKYLQFFQDSGIYKGYDRIKRMYGTSCYVSVSVPIFNQYYTKSVISINYLCGPLNGSGCEFVLEKKKGKWIIIDKYGTWES